ncbi:hypothetical protein BD31_I0004 [Candidatus Nitrosopumilus salaria BD31]|uniref:Uncharacterized protein n=1 Tax=Candidatus Nitrosopumilus salarius BD31 TaxID=859350 RepID=I3D2H2_9ARCH|nr:hypothetical protein [Candidatus Nitrosopumilus salaria]EIJ65915.1 hypothetical protein BD31_I0004 [Candidatus Nitrosopumilus salaria BD31]
MERKNRIIVMYLVGAGIVAFFGLLFMYPTIMSELGASLLIFGGIGYGIYKLAKKKLDKKIAIIIGIVFGLILYLMFSYYTYLQNS